VTAWSAESDRPGTAVAASTLMTAPTSLAAPSQAWHSGTMTFAAYLAAISLATVAAWFSIRGMLVLFPGVPTEEAIRWLILLMVLTCDPLAIAPTAAASGGRPDAECDGGVRRSSLFSDAIGI